MMRTLKQRVLLTLIATFVGATLGATGGGILGFYLTLLVTEQRLVWHAANTTTKADARVTEAVSALAAASGASYSACSDSELAYFRVLIFEAKFLKDAGRMKAGGIDCSADLGRLAKPMQTGNPDATTPFGTQVFKNLAPYQGKDQDVIALGAGGFFVAYVPYLQLNSESDPYHYTETLTDHLSGQPISLLGEPPALTGVALVTNGHGRLGNGIYATNCSSKYVNCVHAFISIHEALQADRIQLWVYLLLSGLTGAFLGFSWAMLYVRNRSLDQQLRRAIRNDKLRVAYQPVVDLVSKRIVGAEALARWNSEDDLVIGPDVFIPIAEEQGFVGEITRLVLRHALRDFGDMLRRNPEFRVNINIAVSDLSDPEFLPMLEQTLHDANVPPSSLGIEITESGTARQQVAIDAIQQMHRNGHSVFIDDFGTGYSSLAYLHALSVDAIKIDKAFTQAIGTEAVTVSILPQILAMAEALKLQVVVEGVETAQQGSYFAGSTQPVFAQGWLFGRPVPFDEFHRILDQDGEKALAGSGTTDEA
jgi:sensor c-di-GMP phosphodiesterase-like protein